MAKLAGVKLHINFGYILSFMNQLCANSLFHCFLLKNPSSHNSGSGLYTVTRTAGLVLPFGIPKRHVSACLWYLFAILGHMDPSHIPGNPLEESRLQFRLSLHGQR